MPKYKCDDYFVPKPKSSRPPSYNTATRGNRTTNNGQDESNTAVEHFIPEQLDSHHPSFRTLLNHWKETTPVRRETPVKPFSERLKKFCNSKYLATIIGILGLIVAIWATIQSIDPKCVCSHGVPLTHGQGCEKNGEELCSKCDDIGYILESQKCVPRSKNRTNEVVDYNNCICTNGVPVSKKCPIVNNGPATSCEYCDKNFHLVKVKNAGNHSTV